MPFTPSRFLQLPGEVRELIYAHIFLPSNNERLDSDGRVHYRYDLALFKVNHQVYYEARRVFKHLNIFVAVETPWPEAQEHVYEQGRVPMIATDERAKNFNAYSCLITIDAPQLDVRHDQSRKFVILVDAVANFANFWYYSDLTYPRLNERLRLKLRLRDAFPDPTAGPRALPKAVQRKIFEPFGQVKGLYQVKVEGEHYESLAKAMRAEMDVPYTSPEDCLAEAFKCKNAGNAAFGKQNWNEAIKCYEDSFFAIHVICDGRRRQVWGDAYFREILRSGEHKGQVGHLVRLTLRVQLVSNVVASYLKLEDWDMAYYWGMRTINLMREGRIDDDETPIPGFTGNNSIGKIYYRTGVAAKNMDNAGEARRLLRVAVAYLPHDQAVQAEHASMALKLG